MTTAATRTAIISAHPTPIIVYSATRASRSGEMTRFLIFPADASSNAADWRHQRTPRQRVAQNNRGARTETRTFGIAESTVFFTEKFEAVLAQEKKPQKLLHAGSPWRTPEKLARRRDIYAMRHLRDAIFTRHANKHNETQRQTLDFSK